MTDILLGDMRLSASGTTGRITGESHRRTTGLTATAKTFTVTSPDWEVLVGLRHWSNDDDDVALHERGTAPQYFDRLRTKGRMGIHRGQPNVRWVELDQARIGEGDHPALRSVPLDDLDFGAGCSVSQALAALGATAVGTREAVFGETNTRRTRMCVSFPETAMIVAVAAYTLTRLAPLHRALRT